MHVSLSSLPRGHRLRVARLSSIGAERRLHDTAKWLPIATTWKIAGNSFDDLGPAWTDTADWRCIDPISKP